MRYAFMFKSLLAPACLACVMGCASILPIPSGPLTTWDGYHEFRDIDDYLKFMTRRHSAKSKLRIIGRSREGRPIYAVEINNPRTGPAEDKPGFYIDGNIHGGEVLAGEGALYMIDVLLEQYDQDPEIRKLVDGTAFYIVPIVNPDGRAISMQTPESHRWNTRPVDQDGDGKVDEDPPEDLDKDGRILRMRVLDRDGRWKISPDDPRLMVRRGRDEVSGKFYRMYREGIDNDEDGRFNEDQVGGIDLNRNFPVNWSQTQFASGPYPLSEPESLALVKYITARPNIAAIHTFHTSGGMILRFPTLVGQDWDYPEEDLRDYAEIGAAGAEITGYHNYARDKKTIVDLMNPGHGVFNDWASKVFGVLAMTTEMWKHPFGGTEELRWNDLDLEGEGFIDWYAYDHPQLGEVELGGWDRWSNSNPPEHMIEAELERNARWVLDFAGRLPRLRLTGVQLTPGDQTSYSVNAEFENSGWMATATAQARDVLQSARPLRASIHLENARLIGDLDEMSFPQLPGKRADGSTQKHSARWQVRVLDENLPARVEIRVTSEKAGSDRLSVEIPANGG
ncbi:MAG: M14 family metallopeptidase [Planctomycetota bacterium]